MLALKRLFASPTRLVGQPNFEKAPWYYIDLSGTKVAFKNPPQTTPLISKKVWPEAVNIYGDTFEIWSDGEGASACIFKNHWSYFGGYIDGLAGGISVQFTLQRRFISSKDKLGLKDKLEARGWIWRRISKYWDKMNKEKEERHTNHLSPPVLSYYPATPEKMGVLTCNDLEWIESRLHVGSYDSISCDRTYYLPISDEHLLLVIFTLTSDLPAVVKEAELTIKHFMENFHVKWSEG